MQKTNYRHCADCGAEFSPDWVEPDHCVKCSEKYEYQYTYPYGGKNHTTKEFYMQPQKPNWRRVLSSKQLIDNSDIA